MSRGLKRFFIVCAAVAVAGLILTAAGFALGGVRAVDRVADKYDWISGSPGEMKYEDVREAAGFDSLRIRGDMDVRISSGARDSVRIGYGENMKAPEVQFSDGTLVVDGTDRHKGITINLTSESCEPVVEIVCSSGRALDSIDIETENGDVEISGIHAGSIVVDSEYGELCMDTVNFDRGELDIENGDIVCSDIVSGGIIIENEYGDCSLSGAISGTNEISVENGNLQIDTSLSQNKYRTSARTENGCLSIGDFYKDDYECSFEGGSGPNKLKLSSEYGDVKVNFDCGKQASGTGESGAGTSQGSASGSEGHNGSEHQYHDSDH